MVGRSNVRFTRGYVNPRVWNFGVHYRFPDGLNVVVDVDEEQRDVLIVQADLNELVFTPLFPKHLSPSQVYLSVRGGRETENVKGMSAD